MPNVKELAAKMSREAAEALARSVSAMPSERSNWQPFDTARDAHDQVVECGGLNYMAAKTLETKQLPPFSRSQMEELKSNNDTMDKAIYTLQAATEALTAAILAFPDNLLDDTLHLPFNGGMERTYAEIMFLPYWNMSYHHGQVNYIQTMYGDKEHH